MTDNFRGNGALTFLYRAPDWLLPLPLESQEIELFRSQEANITVKPQLSMGVSVLGGI